MPTIKSCLFLILVLLYPALSTAADEKTRNFLVLSDIHLNLGSKHTMEFSPYKKNADNDLDPPTFNKLIKNIRDNIKQGRIAKPAFILLLGDIQGHQRNAARVPETEQYVFHVLQQNFPHTPILYTFGNNDSLVLNYGPFTLSEQQATVKSPYEIALQAGWRGGFLSTGVSCGKKSTHPCILNENTTQGHYSALLAPKLRLISLNSVLFSTERQAIVPHDATRQLQWLETQLTEASKNHESVIISMHIPPGYNIFDHSAFWKRDNLTYFLSLIETHHKNILGILAAHTHQEEVTVIKNAVGKTIAGVYFTAALATTYGNQPSVKTFYFSHQGTPWALTNFDTFSFSLVNGSIVLTKLYNYVDYYCTNKKQTLFGCLDNITMEKMRRYLSAGNPHLPGIVDSPADRVLFSNHDKSFYGHQEQAKVYSMDPMHTPKEIPEHAL